MKNKVIFKECKCIKNDEHYNYSKIDSYHCPVKIIVSVRGLGKTFGKLKTCTEDFVDKSSRFIYVVETDEMTQELTKNNGEKFWSKLLEFYSEYDTGRKRYYYNKLTELVVDDSEEEQEEIFTRKINTKLVGGTIKINGETSGYIVSMNSFGEVKRNNFTKIKYIIVDEFISEKMDKTTLQNPRKISSLIQSISRTQTDVKIYLLGNAIRFDDPILSRMGFKLEKYGWYLKYDNKGLFAVLHFVDPQEYPKFQEKHDNSVAGRFAKMIGESNEEENKFLSDLPKEKRLNTFNYRKKGLNINIVKENTIVTIKELNDGKFACVPFAGKNTKNLYCMTEKEQGYKLGYHIICNKALKQMLLNMVKADILYFYSEVEYVGLKFILKGD